MEMTRAECYHIIHKLYELNTAPRQNTVIPSNAIDGHSLPSSEHVPMGVGGGEESERKLGFIPPRMYN